MGFIMTYSHMCLLYSSFFATSPISTKSLPLLQLVSLSLSLPTPICFILLAYKGMGNKDMSNLLVATPLKTMSPLSSETSTYL